MDHTNSFKDMSESIPDYRKKVLLILLIKIDNDFLHDIGFSERDINRLSLELKKFRRTT